MTMTDENKALTGNENGQGATPSETTTSKTEISSLPPDIQEYIRSLRREAEDGRKEKRTAEKSAKEAEEKRLAEQAEWQKLAQTYKADLDKLAPIAEQHEAITAAFNASLDNRLKQIPDDVRKKTVDPVRTTMTPVMFSNWLDANFDILRSRQAPPLDGGAGISGGAKGGGQFGTPSATDIEMARAMNIPIQTWMKRRFEQAWRKEHPDQDWATFEKTLPKES